MKVNMACRGPCRGHVEGHTHLGRARDGAAHAEQAADFLGAQAADAFNPGRGQGKGRAG